MRTVLGMHKFIKHVDDVIRLEMLPALLNSIVPEVDRQLYSLLLRNGGLGILILPEIVESQFEASQAIALSLFTIMITHDNTLPNKTEVNEVKRKITNEQEIRISEQNWNKIKPAYLKGYTRCQDAWSIFVPRCIAFGRVWFCPK